MPPSPTWSALLLRQCDAFTTFLPNTTARSAITAADRPTSTATTIPMAVHGDTLEGSYARSPAHRPAGHTCPRAGPVRLHADLPAPDPSSIRRLSILRASLARNSDRTARPMTLSERIALVAARTLYCAHGRHDDCAGRVGLAGGDSRPACVCACHAVIPQSPFTRSALAGTLPAKGLDR